MRWQETLREATRNVASGTSRALTLLIAIGIVGFIAAGLDTVTIDRILHRTDEFRAAGADINLVAASEGINGEQCEALSETSGVEASGALNASSNDVTFIPLPDSPIKNFEVSPGFAQVLGLTDAHVGDLFVSRMVADQLGMTPDDVAYIDTGRAFIADIFDYPDDGRIPLLEYATISIIDPHSLFDQCWAVLWPPSEGRDALLVTTVSPGTRVEDVKRSQLNTTFGQRFHPVEDFFNRTTRWAPVVAAWGALALTVLVQRRRVLELSLARHLGVSSFDLIRILIFELVLWLTPLLTLALGVAITVSEALNPTDSSALLWPQLRCWVGITIGVVLASVYRALSASPNTLFRYFQSQG